MEQRCDDGCNDGPVQQESHALLSAPHMLYNIFLYLPQQDLLLIQRVCRVWRGVITSSRVLQAALFLQPPVIVAVDESVRMNPLLLSRFPAFFDNYPGYQEDDSPTTHHMGPYYTTHWAESIRPWAQFVRDGSQEECSQPSALSDDESSRSIRFQLHRYPCLLLASRSTSTRTAQQPIDNLGRAGDVCSSAFRRP
jgi:hypothetical protein